MELDIQNGWPFIRDYFEKAVKASRFVSFATVSESGEPTVTPIGSLLLNDDQTGFYMERCPRSIPANAEHNRQFCVLAENTRLAYLARRLLGEGVLGIKLYGTLGEKRPASEIEILRIRRRLLFPSFSIPFGPANRIETLLLSGTIFVRDLNFHRAEAVTLPFKR
jgi:hypothetical protein